MDVNPMMDGRRSENASRMLVADAIVFGLMGLITCVISAATPTQRGFFCDDESIRYPYKSSTVSIWLLYAVGLFLLILVILLVEYSRVGLGPEYSPYRVQNYRIRSSHWRKYKILACFACGLFYSEMTVQIGKVLIGRLRPNFIDVCRPNLETLCSNPNSHAYIESCNCTQFDTSDARLSFPSGHSSFSFYVAVFLVLYLQHNLKMQSIVAKSFLQFVLVALAWYVALSRVTDHMHHWSDVLAGMLIGSVGAIFNVNATGMCKTLQAFTPDTGRPTKRREDLSAERSRNQTSSSSNAKQNVPLLTR